MSSHFTQQEILRYSRQLPLLGLKGQEKLKHAKVLCVGVGGLGCPSLLYLAAAGIGKIGIVDGDKVDLSNLHRQILFTEKDVGRWKVECAQERLIAHRSELQVETYPVFLDSSNAPQIIANYEVILDGTDNYRSRYLVNAFCKKLDKPLVSASIFQYDAQVGVFNHRQGPCYQCLYPEPPSDELIPNCTEAGVLGALPGIAGILQATEALKIILNLDKAPIHQFLSFNLLTMEFRHYPVFFRPNCPACMGKEFSQEGHLGSRLCENKESLTHLELDPYDLRQWLQEKRDLCLLDVRQPHERELCHIGGILWPLQEMEMKTLQLPKDSTIVCYCKSGGRSLKAVKRLKEQGYSDVYSLKGGIEHWMETVGASPTSIHFSSETGI